MGSKFAFWRNSFLLLIPFWVFGNGKEVKTKYLEVLLPLRMVWLFFPPILFRHYHPCLSLFYFYRGLAILHLPFGGDNGLA